MQPDYPSVAKACTPGLAKEVFEWLSGVSETRLEDNANTALCPVN
jgi:hypothetical protein